MKTLLNIAAALGLLLTIVPAFCVAAGQLEWQTHAHLMSLGMIIWFVSVSWQSRKSRQRLAE